MTTPTEQQKNCYFERITRLMTRLSDWPDADVQHNWIGFPPPLSCTGCHPLDGGSCNLCHWNRCQRCGTKNDLVCSCCGMMYCTKPWRFKIIGWTGICADCDAHSSFVPARVPDDCKAAFEELKHGSAVAPVAASSAAVSVPVAVPPPAPPVPVPVAAPPPVPPVPIPVAAPPAVPVVASPAAAVSVPVAAPPPAKSLPVAPPAAVSSALDDLADEDRITTILMVMAEAVYEACPDAIHRMGYPKIRNLLKCNGVHKDKNGCAHCWWDRCIVCGSIEDMECLFCSSIICSCSKPLYAWSGQCRACQCKGIKPLWDPSQLEFMKFLEDEYGSAPSAAMKSPPAAAAVIQPPQAPAAVVQPPPPAQPSADEASVLSIFLPEWKRPKPGDDPMESTLFESTDPDLLAEMQTIVTDSMEKSWLNADRLTGYSLFTIGKVKSTNEYYLVEKVEINQNPLFRLLYHSQLTRLRYINDRRSPALMVDNIEKRLFHGTAEANKLSIARDGLSLGKARHGACGKGANYASEYVRLSAEGHSDSGSRCMVILVDALVGRNTFTDSHHTEPPAGYDSGGDGTGWKYAIFDNSRIYPRFFLTLSRVTRAEYHAELKRRKSAKRAKGPDDA